MSFLGYLDFMAGSSWVLIPAVFFAALAAWSAADYLD
jgi:hypothetical protein